MVHGDSRNAPDHLRYVIRASSLAGRSDVLVVSPQFMVADDLGGVADADRLVYWTSSGWKQGDESATAPYARSGSVSSFAAVDQLVLAVLGSGSFPNLADIVVAGHSAGGQYANRHAALSTLASSVGSAGAGLRHVVANAGTYLYLDATRYVDGRWSPITTAMRDACRRINSYKYGLEALNPYARGTGEATIVGDYAGRRVTYLVGSLDRATDDPALDTSCAAGAQGPDRLSRGLRYADYLGTLYGVRVYERQQTTIVVGVGHDARAMYASPEGRAALFSQP